MEDYVDGYLLPVPEGQLDRYREISRIAGQVWKDHGALEYCEWVADDLTPGGGETASFRQMAGARDGETVIFSWIRYRSREDRDRINAAAMKDPRITESMTMESSPFDPARMAWGGFRALVRF